MTFNADNEDMRTPPQTEDSAERGWADQGDDSPDPESYVDLGKSQVLDGDDAGDIADEGSGHRG